MPSVYTVLALLVAVDAHADGQTLKQPNASPSDKRVAVARCVWVRGLSSRKPEKWGGEVRLILGHKVKR